MTDRDAPGDADRSASTDDRDHETVFSVTYPEKRRARLVAEALAPEVGELDESRSAATVSHADDTVRVRIVADDLAALRAGITSWSRLIAVAERLTTDLYDAAQSTPD